MWMILLFVLTLLVFAGLAWALLYVGRDSDEKLENSRLTKNQWRMMGWVISVIVALIAAMIEWYVVVPKKE